MSEEEDLLSNLPSDVLAAVEGENAKSGTATPKEKAESISGTPAGSETPKVPASDENSKDESGAASGPNYAYVVSTYYYTSKKNLLKFTQCRKFNFFPSSIFPGSHC